MSHNACTSGTFRVLTVASLQRLKVKALTPTRRLWSVVCDKVSECTDHSADQNSSSVCQVYGHTWLDGQHISCRSLAGRCLIIHPTSRTSRPVISIFSYTSRNSYPVSVRIFIMTMRRWMSRWFQSQAANFLDTGYKSWSDDMTNVSIPEVNM